LAIHILVAQRVYKLSTSRSFSNIFFLLLSPTNFEQDWVLYTVVCFHIMTKKMTGSVELNLQWELYFFTHLFSSTGLWCLLVLGLGLQFNINEICMLYLLVSNPCILSSGYNVSVKKYNSHWRLSFTNPIVFFFIIWKHIAVYKTQSCSKFVGGIKRKRIFCRT